MSLTRPPVLEAVEDKAGRLGALMHDVAKLPEKIGAAVLIDGDVVDVGEVKGRPPAGNRRSPGRESRPNA